MLQDMAQRVANAENAFAELLQEIAGVSEADARKVTGFYLRKKLAKLDATIGRISVKHGGYLDREAILRAVAMA